MGGELRWKYLAILEGENGKNDIKPRLGYTGTTLGERYYISAWRNDLKQGHFRRAKGDAVPKTWSLSARKIREITKNFHLHTQMTLLSSK